MCCITTVHTPGRKRSGTQIPIVQLFFYDKLLRQHGSFSDYFATYLHIMRQKICSSLSKYLSSPELHLPLSD